MPALHSLDTTHLHNTRDGDFLFAFFDVASHPCTLAEQPIAVRYKSEKQRLAEVRKRQTEHAKREVQFQRILGVLSATLLPVNVGYIATRIGRGRCMTYKILVPMLEQGLVETKGTGVRTRWSITNLGRKELK